MVTKRKNADIKGKNTILAREEVLHVAALAQLTLSEKEIQKYQGELSEILEYVGQLKKVDTRNIPETSQVTGLENVFREDLSEDRQPCLSQEEALQNAPHTEKNMIKVKAILKAK